MTTKILSSVPFIALHVTYKFPQAEGNCPEQQRRQWPQRSSFLPTHPLKRAEQICQEYKASRSSACSCLPTKHSESKHYTMTYGLKLQNMAKCLEQTHKQPPMPPIAPLLTRFLCASCPCYLRPETQESPGQKQKVHEENRSKSFQTEGQERFKEQGP